MEKKNVKKPKPTPGTAAAKRTVGKLLGGRPIGRAEEMSACRVILRGLMAGKPVDEILKDILPA